MSWYHQLKKKKFELESDLENINSMISKYNQESQMFQNQFSTKKVGAALKQFSQQGKGRNEEEEEYYGGNQGIYRQNYHGGDYEERKETGDIMRQQQHKGYSREELSNKDDKARRIIELTRNSKPLNLQMQHAYSYK